MRPLTMLATALVLGATLVACSGSGGDSEPAADAKLNLVYYALPG